MGWYFKVLSYGYLPLFGVVKTDFYSIGKSRPIPYLIILSFVKIMEFLAVHEIKINFVRTSETDLLTTALLVVGLLSNNCKQSK